MKRIIVIVIAAVAAALVVTACGSKGGSGEAHPSASAAVSSAAAKLHELATDPRVQAKVKQVAPKVTSCAADNGIELTITGAGTDHMQAQLGHVKGTTMLHPVSSIKDTFACMGLTGDNLDKLKAYAHDQILANGLGQGAGTKDFTAILTYAAGLMTGEAQ